ncbi:hypothetical protein M514_18586 [Trichuris suis]|uniref:Uncharacterized protein n=1 Tax=Trichuris suis TaxID=68888 RepID=A0A085NIC1_9BILA|nr:hypothetical protein M514_18586 [Trichuris suis]
MDLCETEFPERYIHFVRTGIIIFHQPYIFCKLLHQIIRKHYIGQTLLWQQMQTNASQKRAQYRNMEQDDKFNKLPTQRLMARNTSSSVQMTSLSSFNKSTRLSYEVCRNLSCVEYCRKYFSIKLHAKLTS